MGMGGRFEREGMCAIHTADSCSTREANTAEQLYSKDSLKKKKNSGKFLT